MAEAVMERVPTMADVQAYVDGVLSGEIVTGELVRLAVERHVRDLETAESRGFYFDEEAAARRLAFCPLVIHVKGPLALQPFYPEPWQCFIFAMIHGWRRIRDGRRRFRTAYIQVAKKNGKTFMGASEGLWGLGLDGEIGAEVYSIATAEDQAKESWKPAAQMVRMSPELQEIFSATKKAILDEETGSTWRPLGRDSKVQEGKGASLLLVDELHVHPDGQLLHNMQAGMAARSQPLTFIMTTAGAGRTSYCYSVRQTYEKILRGIIENDTVFAFIAEPDPGDDWRTETAWRKANPNLGVSVSLEFLEEACEDAVQNPRLENDFRRYHCNEWVEQVTRWLPMHRWDECSEVPAHDFGAQIEWYHRTRAQMRGRTCYAGLDLARTTDLCACALLFPPETTAGKWIVLPWFWLPSEKVRPETGVGDNVPYDMWKRAGLVTVHEGPTVEPDRIEEDIARLSKVYRFAELPFDPAAGGLAIALRLQDRGLPVVEWSNRWVHVSPAAKKLEELVLTGRLEHGANPVLRWMASNVAVKVDGNDNLKPVKDKSTGRIDGIVALIMALGRAMHATSPRESVYARRGVRTV